MEKIISEFFKNEHIEYYASLPAEALKVINARKMPPDIKACVVFLIPYNTGTPNERNVSLYAVGKDYHLYFRQLASRFSECVGIYAENVFCFCDSSPIDEVKAAKDAKLGYFGKNRLLINKKYGSYVFIGTFLFNIPVSLPEFESQKNICLSCGACERECAFLSGKDDICMSELTQRKVVSPEEEEKIKSHYLSWGCDRCQEICPENKNACLTPIDFFYNNRVSKVSAELIQDMSVSEFTERAYGWRKKEVILRNLSLQKQ